MNESLSAGAQATSVFSKLPHGPKMVAIEKVIEHCTGGIIAQMRTLNIALWSAALWSTMQPSATAAPKSYIPAWFAIELIAQAAALGSILEESSGLDSSPLLVNETSHFAKVNSGMVVRVRNLKFPTALFVTDNVKLTVSATWDVRITDLLTVRGEVRDANSGQLLAHGEILILGNLSA